MTAAHLREHSAWIWLALAMAVIVALKLVTSQPSQPPPPLSVTSDQAGGALAAYRWLDRLGYRVERESDKTVGLNRLQAGRDTLMVISPEATFSSRLVSSILHWVRSGGRLVVASDGSAGGPLLSQLGVQLSSTFPAAIRMRQPLLLAPPVSDVSGTAATVGQAARPRAVTVASTAHGAVLLQIPDGKGRIWILTAPNVLDNQTIQSGDNRALLLNLAGRPPARVAFDEYQIPAGSIPSVPTDWLTQTVWGIAAAFTVVLLALYRWLAGRRLGPPVVPLTEGHRPLTEYVVSLGGLLRRGQERQGVLRMYQDGLERDLRERFGPQYRETLEAESRAQFESMLEAPPNLSEHDLIRRATAIVEWEDNLRRSRV